MKKNNFASLVKQEMVSRFESVVSNEIKEYRDAYSAISGAIESINSRVSDLKVELSNLSTKSWRDCQDVLDAFLMEKKKLQDDFEAQRKFIRNNSVIIDLKNDDGYIYAYCVYQIVDENGKTKNGGKYVYIEELWIHEKFRKNTLNDIIAMIATDPNIFNSTDVYWENRKKNYQVKQYKIARFLKGLSYGEKSTRTS